MVHTGLLFVFWVCTLSSLCSSQKATKKDAFTLVHNGYEYRAMEDDIQVDAHLVDQKSARCHKDWVTLPPGWEVVPDKAELRKFVTAHTWSTHVVIFSSLKGYTTFAPPGKEFGDAQDKARRRERNGVVEYMCPWECYQIIMRRQIPDPNAKSKTTKAPAAKTPTADHKTEKETDPNIQAALANLMNRWKGNSDEVAAEAKVEATVEGCPVGSAVEGPLDTDMIQVIYDSSSSKVLEGVQLVEYREKTLQGVPATVELHPWPSPEATDALCRIPVNARPANMQGRMVAHLPTGLVLPSVQEDVMKLIYEIEYIALVQLPEVTRIATLDRSYLAPLKELRETSAASPWWSQPGVYQIVGQMLGDASFAIIDNFLPDKVVTKLLKEAQSRRPQMVRGPAPPSPSGKITKGEDPSRGDLIKSWDPMSAPSGKEFVEAVDTLIEGLKGSGAKTAVRRLRAVDFATEAVFSIFPGDASRHLRHFDNTEANGRRLNVVLYLNKIWKPDHGGRLRIFDATMQSTQVKADVDPLWNRLVIFWSDEEVPQEVLSSYRDHFSLTIWYLCGEESLGSEQTFKQLMDDKVRVVTGKTRHESVMNAARTEEQREILMDIPFGDADMLNSYLRTNRKQLSELFQWGAKKKERAEL
eukprot:gnl/TRDRNA2_/TRDRNA2_90933_c0_seq1.p1 gnl/TRDRNA2_/TRDRNA2_90933_c0~~gnl/TRDRNA2_/TRDRNA2_90933_c0_seq1.p1  ORF type:complete len:641 (+),score=111.81 gnl/TRDRNA2_/TRDRNA2_90933_c0_seq1:80-2002(+)